MSKKNRTVPPHRSRKRVAALAGGLLLATLALSASSAPPPAVVHPVTVANTAARPLILGDSIPAGYGVFEDTLQDAQQVWPQARDYAVEGNVFEDTQAQLNTYLTDHQRRQDRLLLKGASRTAWTPDRLYILAGANGYAKTLGYSSFPNLAKQCVMSGCPTATVDQQAILQASWEKTLEANYGLAQEFAATDSDRPGDKAKTHGKHAPSASKPVPVTVFGYPQFTPASGDLKFTFYGVKTYTVPTNRVEDFYNQWLTVNTILKNAVAQVHRTHPSWAVTFQPLDKVLQSHYLGTEDSWVVEPPSHYTGHLNTNGLSALFQALANQSATKAQLAAVTANAQDREDDFHEVTSNLESVPTAAEPTP